MQKRLISIGLILNVSALSCICYANDYFREKRSELVKHQDGHRFAPGSFLYTAVFKLEWSVFRSETLGGPKRQMFTQTLESAFQITSRHFYIHLIEGIVHREFIN